MRLVQLGGQTAGQGGVQAGTPSLHQARVSGAPLAESFPGGNSGTAKEEVLSGVAQSPIGLMGKRDDYTPSSWG